MFVALAEAVAPGNAKAEIGGADGIPRIGGLEAYPFGGTAN